MDIINSKRIFAVVFIEGQAAISHVNVRLANIFEPSLPNEDDKMGGLYEWKYAVQDEIDSVLDLKPGERITMQFNRDNKDSTGIIKRII